MHQLDYSELSSKDVISSYIIQKISRYINKSNSHNLIQGTLWKDLPPLIALVGLLLGVGMPWTLTQATEADIGNLARPLFRGLKLQCCI